MWDLGAKCSIFKALLAGACSERRAEVYSDCILVRLSMHCERWHRLASGMFHIKQRSMYAASLVDLVEPAATRHLALPQVPL